MPACTAQAVECIRNGGVGKSKQTSLVLDPCMHVQSHVEAARSTLEAGCATLLHCQHLSQTKQALCCILLYLNLGERHLHGPFAKWPIGSNNIP